MLEQPSVAWAQQCTLTQEFSHTMTSSPLESILDPDDVNVNVHQNRLRTADHTADTTEEYLGPHQTTM